MKFYVDNREKVLYINRSEQMFVCDYFIILFYKEELNVMDSIQQDIIPAQEGLKYFVAGVPLPVNCFINYCGDMLPVIDFSFASD